jgi:ferric iron reductase protein FhuF|tara:strand:- start:239 stop:427 length:189 start_codon:yes stop_codon:yes gene_type:complete
MDEKWRNDMSLMEKRIENIMKVMKKAKDYDMKVIWNNKLKQLFNRREAKAYERLEDQARMVH